MLYTELKTTEFTERLASSDAVPGGGGASALAGALGAALGSMVANLTVNKKKYIAVREEMTLLLEKCDVLSKELLKLVDEDAEGFAPLAKAYSLPATTDEEKAYKARVLEEATLKACEVPVKIVEQSYLAITLHERLCEIGSTMVISDVGVGVLLCKAALEGAALNVYINTKSLSDRVKAEEINTHIDRLIKNGCVKADETYSRVLSQLK